MSGAREQKAVQREGGGEGPSMKVVKGAGAKRV